MLYIVPTPIGNLEDMTLRAIRVLKECDLILCEDTRHASTLLKKYEIATKTLSFHSFSEAKREEEIVQKLQNGEQIALISDAGTPLIQDPGTRLVARCHQENISITALPGPCAIPTALSLSGLEATPFQFLGFVPKKTGEMKKLFAKAYCYPGLSLFYETPHHLKKALEALPPEMEVAVCRELTKKFEEFLFDRAKDLVAHFQNREPKGEMVLILKGEGQTKAFEDLSAEELMEKLEQEFTLMRKEAIKVAAELKGISKKNLYKT
ncbi:MAG: 16S rRNA (cytidine(1402)-2'-O)-methyltransferase [Candidatus Algichlamydia australiensis]|nr:16S rRNA (cytidine(1402)-2'-O)-methyltransferase [Chlamydiales bacterium]